MTACDKSDRSFLYICPVFFRSFSYKNTINPDISYNGYFIETFHQTAVDYYKLKFDIDNDNTVKPL